jgi:hypothetical protein
MADLSLVRPKVLLAPMRARRPAMLGWIIASAVMIAALLWPALANRFPIVFYDTGGYLASALGGNPGHGRAAIYGAFLWLGIPTAFWLNIVAQAAITVWLVALTLRTHGLGRRPTLALVIVVGLAVLTGLPWYAAQLLPDIWLPDAVLALYLLAFRPRALRGWQRVALVVIVAFAMASHLGTLGVAIGLVAVLIVAAPFALRLALPRPALSGPAIAAVAGVLLALTSNLVLNSEFAFTRGGANFLFGRILQTGIAAQYLEDNCPDPTLRLCTYRHELPPDGDNWLWDSEGSPLYKLGGWEAFAPEAKRIVTESLRQYPWQHLAAFLQGTFAQLVMVETGEDITPWAWHVHDVLEHEAPRAYQRFLAARQQQAPFDFAWLNYVHVPIALLSMALLPAVIVLAPRGRVSRKAAALAAVVLLALLGNAVICGGLSNPHHRYQSRLVPLASLAVAIAALTRRAPALRPEARSAPFLAPGKA